MIWETLTVEVTDRLAVVTVHLHPHGLTPPRCSDIRAQRVST